MTKTQAWDYAIGMIKVDGLEPTEEFKEYIEKEKRGEVTMADIKQFLAEKFFVEKWTKAPLPAEAFHICQGRMSEASR